MKQDRAAVEAALKRLQDTPTEVLRHAATLPASRLGMQRTVEAMRAELDYLEPYLAAYRAEERRMTAALEDTAGEIRA